MEHHNPLADLHLPQLSSAQLTLPQLTLPQLTLPQLSLAQLTRLDLLPHRLLNSDIRKLLQDINLRPPSLVPPLQPLQLNMGLCNPLPDRKVLIPLPLLLLPHQVLNLGQFAPRGLLV